MLRRAGFTFGLMALALTGQEKAVEQARPGVPTAGGGARYALVYGVSNYRDPKIRGLSFAHKDALDFEKFLKSDRGGPVRKIVPLIDQNATRAALRHTINLAFAEAKPGDTIVVFMSSHGVTAGNNTYLVTHDSKKENFRDTAYSVDEFRAAISGWFNRKLRIELYIDACHAGTIGDIPEKSTVNGAIAAMGLAKTGEMLAVLGSDYDTTAFEDFQGNGVFTHFLLEGLNAGVGDKRLVKNTRGEVALSPLFEFMREEIKKFTEDRQIPLLARVRLPLTHPVASALANGIAVRPWTGKLRTVSMGNKDASPDAEAKGLTVEGPPTELDERVRRLIQLEDQGQARLIEYMRGDEVTLPREHFEAGARDYAEASALEPQSEAIRGKQRFFAGRALLYDSLDAPSEPDRSRQRAARLARAQELLREAVRLDPEGAYAHNGLGIAQLEAGEYEAALRSFDEAIRLSPYWPYPRHNRALVLAQRGDNRQVVAEYAQARKWGSEYAYLAYNQGLLYQRANQFGEARAAYRDALELRGRVPELPPLASAWIALGTVATARNRGKDAEKYFAEAGKALDRVGGDELQKRALRHNQALLYAAYARRPGRLAKWSDPVPLWRDLSQNKFLPSAFALAEYLTKHERLAEAAAEYEWIEGLAPDHTGARVARVRLLLAQRQVAAARLAVNEALRRQPDSAALKGAAAEVAKAELARGGRGKR